MNLVPNAEPFSKLMTQGMVLHKGDKMSKSKGNVVDPQPLFEKYGADAVRLFMLFAAPAESSLEWSDKGLDGAHRFLSKLWRLAHSNRVSDTGMLTDKDRSSPQYRSLNAILKQVFHDYERVQYNTVVSSLMKMYNLISDDTSPMLTRHILVNILHAMHPMCPQFTQYLWSHILNETTQIDIHMPPIDQDAINLLMITYAIQVNGKTKFTHTFQPGMTKDDVIAFLESHDRLQKWIGGKTYRTIYVPNRLVNFVCN